MTIERLRILLSAYGATPARWPAAEREAAEALLARSAEARAALDDARAFDLMLDRAALALPQLDPVALAAAASAGPQERRAAPRRSPRGFGVWLGWTPLAGLVVAGVAGLVIGLSGIVSNPAVASGGRDSVGTLFAQELDPW